MEDDLNLNNFFITVLNNNESDLFSQFFFETMTKTLVMFVGEMEFGNFNFTVHGNTNNGDYGKNWDGASKAEVALGQVIFMLFVFLFVIVFMNILNAIAIGDIEVL